MNNHSDVPVFALPELLGRGGFTVLEPEEPGLACTNLHDRVMYAPSEDSEVGRGQRMHELAHVAFSPGYHKDEEELDGMIVSAVEDWRIETHLNKTLSWEEKGRTLHQDEVRQVALNVVRAKKNREKMCALAAISIHGQAIEEEFWDEFRDIASTQIDGDELVQVVQNIVEQVDWRMGYNPTFDDTVRVSRWLQRLFDPDGGDGAPAMQQQQVPGLTENMSEEATKGLLDKLKEGRKSGAKQLGGEPDAKAIELAEAMHKIMMENDFDGSEWGKMEIEHPDLTKAHSIRNVARKMRPREIGDALRFPEREETDDRIFGSLRRSKGGTILVDDSGSMQLRADQIEAIIQAAPHAVIAAYSGEGDHGVLRIIASHGKSVADNEIKGVYAGNIIDGPALEWLATQQKPRLWVSDGFVTGIGESEGPHLKTEANLIAVKGQIRRVENAGEAVEFIEKGGFR